MSRVYNVVITKENSMINERSLTWRNTNKLLKNGFYGLKTGITDTAGPCLAASIKINSSNSLNIKTEYDDDLLVIILGCRTKDSRWRECIKLITWAVNKLNK